MVKGGQDLISPAFFEEPKTIETITTMKQPMFKSGAFRPQMRRRYSNFGENALPSFEDMGGAGGLTGGQSSSGTTGSGAFDWNATIQGILNLGNTFVRSFWNNGAQQQANYTNELYKQEQRTNTILWVVIGLVLALGIFLVVRKSK